MVLLRALHAVMRLRIVGCDNLHRFTRRAFLGWAIRHMRTISLLFFLWLGAAAVHATTVMPPTFEQLVDGSTLIFRGRVTAVETVWQGEGAQRHLNTRVTFTVEKTLKGDAAETLTLDFMGGQVGGRRLEIAGLPRFAEGERGVFFVESRDGLVCPIRRWRHGRYRVAIDETGVERIARDDRSPLTTVERVSVPFDHNEPSRAAMEVGMSLADFESTIAKMATRSAVTIEAR